jgi:hypothetical protein
MNRTTSAQRESITKDWARLLPSLGVLKPMVLARIVGPCLQAVRLDLDSAHRSYGPITMLPLLLGPFDDLPYTFDQRLRTDRTGAPDSIDVRWHDRYYQDACRRLVARSVLPLAGDWRVDDVLRAAERYRELSEAGSYNPRHVALEMIKMLAYLGLDSKAREMNTHFQTTILARTPEFAVKAPADHANWVESMNRAARDGAALRTIIDEQRNTLIKKGVPVANLIP